MVFQSASVAFDLSMEEIWVPYLAGATLYVATPEVLADIEKLPALLTEKQVSVIDTVPTLLSVLPADIPSLRLILLAARRCRPRSSRNGRSRAGASSTPMARRKRPWWRPWKRCSAASR